jgi:hypothetical protein
MKHARYLIGVAIVLSGLILSSSLACAENLEALRKGAAQGRGEMLRSRGEPTMCATLQVIGILSLLGLAAFFGAEVRAEGLQGLEAEEREVREETFKRLLKEREERVQKLIALAAKETQGVQGVMIEERGYAEVHYRWHDAKHLAMILLGDLRAAEAVPVLIENLEYRVPRFEGGSFGRFAAVRGSAMHPATEALVKIGMPAVEPVVEKLAGLSEDCVARRLGVLVLDEILGRRLARARLQMVIEEGDKALAESPAQRGALTGDTAKLEARIRNVKAALDLMAPEPPDAWKYPEEVKPTPPLPPWPEHIRKEDLQGK